MNVPGFRGRRQGQCSLTLGWGKDRLQVPEEGCPVLGEEDVVCVWLPNITSGVKLLPNFHTKTHKFRPTLKLYLGGAFLRDP